MEENIMVKEKMPVQASGFIEQAARDIYAQHVFCKCKFLKFADKNGEFCISVLEKVAGCPAGLPDAS